MAFENQHFQYTISSCHFAINNWKSAIINKHLSITNQHFSIKEFQKQAMNNRMKIQQSAFRNYIHVCAYQIKLRPWFSEPNMLYLESSVSLQTVLLASIIAPKFVCTLDLHFVRHDLSWQYYKRTTVQYLSPVILRSLVKTR